MMQAVEPVLASSFSNSKAAMSTCSFKAAAFELTWLELAGGLPHIGVLWALHSRMSRMLRHRKWDYIWHAIYCLCIPVSSTFARFWTKPTWMMVGDNIWTNGRNKVLSPRQVRSLCLPLQVEMVWKTPTSTVINLIVMCAVVLTPLIFLAPTCHQLAFCCQESLVFPLSGNFVSCETRLQ